MPDAPARYRRTLAKKGGISYCETESKALGKNIEDFNGSKNQKEQLNTFE